MAELTSRFNILPNPVAMGISKIFFDLLLVFNVLCFGTTRPFIPRYLEFGFTLRPERDTITLLGTNFSTDSILETLLDSTYSASLVI